MASRINLIDSIQASGYINVGSLSAPANASTGDITGVRLHLGTDGAFGTNSVANFELLGGSYSTTYAFYASGTQTATTAVGALLVYTATPGAGGGASFGAQIELISSPGNAVTIAQSDTLAVYVATGSTAGAVTLATGVDIEPIYGTLKPASVYGVYIGNMGSAGITNAGCLFLIKPTNATNNYYAVFDTGDTSATSMYSGTHISNSAAFTVANNTETAVTFDTEEFDTDGYHEGVTHPSRMTAPTTGLYLFGGFMIWDTSTSGTLRQVYLRINGTTVVASQRVITGAAGVVNREQTVNAVYQLTAGDYVEVILFQDSGANRTVVTVANYSTPAAWMVRLNPSGRLPINVAAVNKFLAYYG